MPEAADGPVGRPTAPNIVLVVVLVLGGVGTAAALARVDGSVFTPYYGSLDPALATFLVVGSGAVALRVLQRRGWFVAWPRDPRAFGVAAIWAAPFRGAG